MPTTPGGGDDLQEFNARNGGSANPYANGASDPNDPWVWLGAMVGQKGKKGYTEDGKHIGRKLSAAKDLPYQWQGKDLVKYMQRASLLTGKKITTRAALAKVWNAALANAAKSYAANGGGKQGPIMSPWDFMAEAGATNTSLAATQTHKSITDVAPGTAWKAIEGAARQLLGRAATSGELQEFAHKANQIAANNPTITTQTTDPQGNTVTKTKGGFSSDDLELEAANLANSDPEAGAYQAAGPLYNAFLTAISNPF